MPLAYDLSDFERYDLTKDEIYKFTWIFTAILTATCIIGYALFRKDTKRLAWTISLVNSFAMTVVGIIYLWYKFPQFDSIFSYGTNGRDHIHSINNYATLTCLWFGLANAFDLVFGTIFYPKYCGLITAYVHHTVFIWIMWTCTTGNGFFTTCAPFASLFHLLLIEELPTFLLSLGSMVPSLRTDLGFGVTFFLFRVLYHAYFFAYGLKSGMDAVLVGIFTLTMTLHLNWFYTWISKYAFPAKGKKTGKASKAD